MKCKIFIFFLFVIFKLSAQDNSMWPNDSLIKKLNVKKRYQYFTSDNRMGYKVDYFDKAGNLRKNEVMSPFTDQVVITTEYYYDSLGRLYASKVTPSGPRTDKAGFINAQDEKYDNLITYYEYNTNNKLKRKYFFDAMNKKIRYECLYLPDSAVMDNKWYNGNGKLLNEKLDYFEKGMYIFKSEVKKYDSSGTLLTSEISTYDNQYNSMSQLIQTKFKGPECASIKTYEYYSNGLLRKKNADECVANWKYTYKYY